MKKRQVTTFIDEKACTGCGRCISVCPSETLAMAKGKAVVTGNVSMECDHCAAVCPAEAIRVEAVDLSLFQFQTFAAELRWLPHGEFDVGRLVNLMSSRRSCRNFSEKQVDRMLFEDLAKIGVTAPSGTNCQPWRFTILPDRDSVVGLGRRVSDFFRKTNRLAEKRWLRAVLKSIGKPELDNYFRNHYNTVEKGLSAWDRGARDLLFHGATAAMIVSAEKTASCPAEDALLATGNILLAAHAMGLGTCLIGFVIEAMRRDPDIQKALGIPAQEDSYAVIALGWPAKAETYRRVAGRKPVKIRYAKKGKNHGSTC
jgi:nitroreductase/Pyruvate/2-oxoacid:ferredoxin oxidoreductase delta subunit